MNELIVTVAIIACILNIIIVVKFFGLCSNVKDLKSKICDKSYINMSSLTNEYKGIKVGDKVIRKRDNKEIEIIKIYAIGDYNYLASDDKGKLEFYNIEEFKL